MLEICLSGGPARLYWNYNKRLLLFGITSEFSTFKRDKIRKE